jgi:hypothetical protein
VLGDCPAGQSVWPVRVSPGDGSFTTGGLVGQSQAGGADLAPGGAEGSSEAAQAGPPVAQRRFLCAAQTDPPEPCLVL